MRARHFLFLSFLFYFTSLCLSQTEDPKNKFAIVGGVGNYEYVHIGLNRSIKKNYYLEAAVGIKPWGISKEKYAMGYLCFGGTILKQKERKIQPYLHLKLLVWDLDNPYNQFVFLGINPEIKFSYKINQRTQLAANIGAIYNNMLYYNRKTYEEVGWPKQWQPSFSVELLYRLK
jgi:hypothetical protein